MRDLDESLRHGLADLAPHVTTDGVYDRVRRRARIRQRRRTAATAVVALTVVVFASSLAVRVFNDGHDQRVAAGAVEPPRLVPSWIPAGFQLDSAIDTPLGYPPAALRTQRFEDRDPGGALRWQLDVDTSGAAYDGVTGSPVSIGGHDGRVDGAGTEFRVYWSVDGRYYRAITSGLSRRGALALLDDATPRTGSKAGVDIRGRAATVDVDPKRSLAPHATWVDYTFVRTDDPTSGITLGVWSGQRVQRWPERPGDTAIDIDVRGHDGRLITAPRLNLSWWEEPTVRVGIEPYGATGLTAGDLRRMAAGLERVDDRRWREFLATASHQPVVEASGSSGRLQWTRLRRGDGSPYLTVEVDSARFGSLTTDGPVHTAQLVGSWWTFVTATSDIEAVRFTRADGTADVQPATLVAGAWDPPYKLYVIETSTEPTWRTLDAVRPDGTTERAAVDVAPPPSEQP
jgi:hypothetical protein